MNGNNGQCDAASSLRRAGLNLTKQRLIVLGMLIDAKRPLTAGHMTEKLNNIHSINKVTVYRTVTTLKEKGIIREIPTGDGVNFYEMACVHNPPHPHFYCRLCKKMTCLEAQDIFGDGDIWKELEASRVETVSISITGLCEQCRSLHRSGRGSPASGKERT